MRNIKILIVEDDAELNQTLKDFLELSGFSAESVFDGERAVDSVYEKNFDLVLLDIRLPSIDGFEVARQIRKFSKVPIIFITALSGEANVVKGFLRGADDYIRKPFSLEELKHRINAVLRRTFGNQDIIEIDERTVFDVARMVLLRDGKIVHLKNKEFMLLKLFLQNRNRVITKEEIFEVLYEIDEEPNENSLRTFIRNLRSVIGKDKIETVKNMGYRYVG